MTLEFSREQLLTLLESLHFAVHLRGDRDTFELEGDLLKRAYEAGFTDVVSRSKNIYVLGNLFSSTVHDEIDDLEDDILWSALADELAARDLHFMKSQEEIDALTDEEYDRIIESQAERYEAEFAEHGADHLTLAHPLPLS